MDNGAVEEPVLLPMVANVWTTASMDNPIDFYWSIDSDIDGIVHLYISVLELWSTEE